MLTVEQLADIRSRINPAYRDTPGTESHERALLVGEIERLRNEPDELRRQLDIQGGMLELTRMRRDELEAQNKRLLAAALKARAALSELLMTRDPIVYSDALRALDDALGLGAPEQGGGKRTGEQAADEIDQLHALLKRQQASYEREIEIEVAAERERWIAACDAERAEFAERAANNDGSRQSDFAFGSVNSAERIKAAGLGA